MLPKVRQHDLGALLEWLDAFPKLEAIGVPLIAWSDAAQQALLKHVANIWDHGGDYPEEAGPLVARCTLRLATTPCGLMLCRY